MADPGFHVGGGVEPVGGADTGIFRRKRMSKRKNWLRLKAGGGGGGCGTLAVVPESVSTTDMQITKARLEFTPTIVFS